MIIFLNHLDRLFCDVFETPNNNNDYFTIITIIGPTINCSDASLKSITRSEKGTFLETSKRINYKSNFRPDEKHMGPALEILHNIHIGCRYHSYLIFVIFFTRAKFLENKIYTEIYTVNCQFTQ